MMNVMLCVCDGRVCVMVWKCIYVCGFVCVGVCDVVCGVCWM